MASPFQSKEAEMAMMNFVKNEVFPSINQIKEVVTLIHSYRRTYYGSFFRKKLSDISEKYEGASLNFLMVYRKFSTPDLLFKDLDLKDDLHRQGMVMADYMNFNKPIADNFDEGFKLLEVIDRQLGRRIDSANQEVTQVLSLVAIVFSIIIFLIQVYMRI